MNKSLFGKTMEKLRKRMNVRLIISDKYVTKPSSVSQKTISKNLVAIHEAKPVLILKGVVHLSGQNFVICNFQIY